jgi:hypothetical protein
MYQERIKQDRRVLLAYRIESKKRLNVSLLPSHERIKLNPRKGRLQRKIRRREQAAILKPPPPPPPAEAQSTPAQKGELDQEWWDQYRAQKQGTVQDHNRTNKKKRSAMLEEEIEKADRIMERKENRQMQTRIPRAKTKGKREGRGGIPGLEIIDGYRPMTTALGPRMTVSHLFRFSVHSCHH